jgi:hypothetical protein
MSLELVQSIEAGRCKLAPVARLGGRKGEVAQKPVHLVMAHLWQVLDLIGHV